jgi:hypothetical protein
VVVTSTTTTPKTGTRRMARHRLEVSRIVRGDYRRDVFARHGLSIRRSEDGDHMWEEGAPAVVSFCHRRKAEVGFDGGGGGQEDG